MEGVKSFKYKGSEFVVKVDLHCGRTTDGALCSTVTIDDGDDYELKKALVTDDELVTTVKEMEVRTRSAMDEVDAELVVVTELKGLGFEFGD